MTESVVAVVALGLLALVAVVLDWVAARRRSW